MLYEALAQPHIFLCMCASGFLSALFFDAKSIFCQIFKKNKVISQILLFFSSFFALFLFYFTNLKVNYGQFRFFTVLAFVLMFAIERFLSENFLAKPVAKCYNICKAKCKRKIDEKQKRKAEQNRKNGSKQPEQQ